MTDCAFETPNDIICTDK